MKWLGNVIEHFDVPHPAPEPVEKASAKFEETTEAYQAARARYYELKTSRLDDLKAANLAAAEARVDGTKPPTLTPSKIEKQLADAEAEMHLLAEATDLTGTALVEAVAAHRDEWITVYKKAEAEAEQRARDLIEAQRLATSDLRTARVAASWLHAFHGGMNQSQFAGTGHSVADFSELEELVNGERRLVGYRDGGPIWEQVKS